MQNFTSNDLLLHHFNEAPLDISFAIDKALESDSLLRREYQQLTQGINEIENFQLTPNDRILENILSAFRHEKDAHVV